MFIFPGDIFFPDTQAVNSDRLTYMWPEPNNLISMPVRIKSIIKCTARTKRAPFIQRFPLRSKRRAANKPWMTAWKKSPANRRKKSLLRLATDRRGKEKTTSPSKWAVNSKAKIFSVMECAGSGLFAEYSRDAFYSNKFSGLKLNRTF